MLYAALAVAVLIAAVVAYVLLKKPKASTPVPTSGSALGLPVASGAQAASAPNIAQSVAAAVTPPPVPGFTQTAAGPISNAVIGMLGGVPGSNASGGGGNSVADPYGDHTGSTFDQGFGYLRFSGDKLFTIKNAVGGRLSVADCYDAVTVQVNGGVLFYAPAGAGEGRFTAEGDVSVLVTCKGSGTLQYSA